MAMVLSTFIEIFGQKLAAVIEEEVALLLGAKGELKKLQAKLRLIENVLEDAEKKAFRDPAISHWADQLKHVMYDADDLIDEFRTKHLLLVRASSSFSSCAGRKLVLRHQIGRRMKSLNLKLEEISKERAQFQLVPSANSTTSAQHYSRAFRMSSSTVESDVVGSRIEEDTKKLVDTLIAKEEDTQTQWGSGVLVFAIAGIGGIGKTTLAQRIFNDPDVKSSFSVKLWVCVPKEVSEVNLLKEILAASGVDHDRSHTRSLLEPMVEEALSGKKFLLVLDDLWSEQVWEDVLRNPLQKGESGSRILITTRNEGVAMRMKAVGIHQVQLLLPEDGWSLMCKKVVSNREESDLEGLKDIGLEIVKKCGGLPLVIKTIARVLCTKGRNRRAWEGVLHSTSWSLDGLPEDVNAALYLSYEDLPSHLKQCFLYCSLFPQDHLFFENALVRYWISEGFVRSEGDLTLEEVGEGYYRELVRRSFLQPDINNYDNTASKMHDLLWSLAKFLTRGESLVVHEGPRSGFNLLVKPRRISVVGVEHEEIGSVFDVLKRNNSLRTLLTFTSQVGDKNVGDVTKTFMRLRVLELGDTAIEKLPYSLANLVHLRHLDLSGSNIRELPKSIENLANLEFMILQNCKNLHNLGNGVVKLQNLRSLDLYYTPVEGMPVGIGRLRHLNTIDGFVAKNSNHRRGQRQWGSLEEVRTLSMLRRFSIYNLERECTARTNEEVKRRENVLKNKQHLSYLELHCKHDTAVDKEEMKRIEEVFELVLCPPPGLDILWIEGFYGMNFPSWMASESVIASFLPNLRWLQLKDCSYCGILPPLGNLPSLNVLKIEGARSVITVGPEFLGQKSAGSSSSPSVLFPKLTDLGFLDMPNWEKWEWEEENGGQETPFLSALPRLRELRLIDCPKLSSLPMGFGRNVTSLTKMAIAYCGSLTQISNFPFLRELIIQRSPNLESISELPALQHLMLIDYEMKFLPEWLLGVGEQQFPALQKLEIKSSIELLRRCLEEGGPEWSKIRHFSRVYGRTMDGSRYFLYTRGSPKSSLNTNIL